MGNAIKLPQKSGTLITKLKKTKMNKLAIVE